MSFFSSTEGPDLSTLDRSAQSFALDTGAVRGLWDVVFDSNTQRFLYGSIDVTPNLAPFQKRAFPSYDPTADLNAAADTDLLAREGRIATVGDTSIFGNLGTNLANDVAGVRKFFTGEGQGLGFNLKTLLLAGLVIGGLWLVWQIVKDAKFLRV